MAGIVATKLQLAWSPEQIAGWLKRTYPDDGNFQVSHETIYRSLFIQARGALKKELLQAFAPHARHASLAPPYPENGQSRPNHGRCIDQGASCLRWKTVPCQGTGKAI